MVRVFIHRELIVRIARFGFGKELKAFISALQSGQHPPRVYKASGVVPAFEPYQLLNLHHHHLHRDSDPLLITQEIDGAVYGIALTTHEIYFHGDKMLWLKKNAEVLDWSDCPALQRKVLAYNPFGEEEDYGTKSDAPDDTNNNNDPPDVPF